MAQELQNDNLAEIVKENEKVVVQFILSWDDDCTRTNAEFNKLASEFSDVEFVTVDVEKNPNSLAMVTVEVFPTTTFFVGGENKAQTHTQKPDVLKEFIAENK